MVFFILFFQFITIKCEFLFFFWFHKIILKQKINAVCFSARKFSILNKITLLYKKFIILKKLK